MTDHEPQQQRWPIGFVLLIVATGLYLLLRLIQMGGWLFDWFRG